MRNLRSEIIVSVGKCIGWLEAALWTMMFNGKDVFFF
jgi:hypothetical protein